LWNDCQRSSDGDRKMVRDGEERKIVEIDIGRARREAFDAYIS
jgi:hypothetical protein